MITERMLSTDTTKRGGGPDELQKDVAKSVTPHLIRRLRQFGRRGNVRPKEMEDGGKYARRREATSSGEVQGMKRRTKSGPTGSPHQSGGPGSSANVAT